MSGDASLELEDVGQLSAECRRAYMRVVVGAHVGWGKMELASWLTGPYRRLTVRDAIGDVPDIAPPSLAMKIASDTISEDRVTELLNAMRNDVVGVLREIMVPEGLGAFAKLALDTEMIRAEGPHRPRARPRMTLVDRVLSLVAVDAIARPEDYEHSLFICDRCHQPVFDVASRPLAICRVHVSGVERYDL